jgi:hypothetical protein
MLSLSTVVSQRAGIGLAVSLLLNYSIAQSHSALSPQTEIRLNIEPEFAIIQTQIALGSCRRTSFTNYYEVSMFSL